MNPPEAKSILLSLGLLSVVSILYGCQTHKQSGPPLPPGAEALANEPVRAFATIPADPHTNPPVPLPLPGPQWFPLIDGKTGQQVGWTNYNPYSSVLVYRSYNLTNWSNAVLESVQPANGGTLSVHDDNPNAAWWVAWPVFKH